MKKIYTMLMMAMMAMAFTSCEDEMIADTLEGTWSGNMYISSNWDGRTYDITRSEITFEIDPFRFTKGSGIWVDYYRGAPWDYVANHINWSVNNGVIYVYFIEDNDRIEIRDYHLNSNRFCGTIYDGDNIVDFELYCVSRPRYDNYRWGFNSWYDNYYWARTRSGDADSTKVIETPKRFVNPELKNK